MNKLNGGLVVVVGVRSTNLPVEYSQHPQVVVWDSQDHGTVTKELPSNTKVVLATRFVSHALFGKIHAEARKRNLAFFPQLTTGRLREQLKELLPRVEARVEPEVQVAQALPEVVPQAVPVPVQARGALVQFIKTEGNLQAVNVSAEARRLFELAKGKGIPGTLNSISNTLHRLKGGAKPVQEKPAVVPTLPKSGGLREMLDDVITMIELIKEEVTKRDQLHHDVMELMSKLQARGIK